MKNLRLRTKVARALRGTSRGMTLIELLIALALFSIIGITFLGALTAASMAVLTGDVRTTAESLARAQMEFVKAQPCEEELEDGQLIYPRFDPIPPGYEILSLDRDGKLSDRIIGIPWNSDDNEPAGSDTGIYKIALVITHNDKVIYTFVNDNPDGWADGEKITLEGYKRE